MRKLYYLMLIVLVPLALTGCGGSGGGDDTTADENTTTDSTEQMAVVTSDNSLSLSQEATRSVSDAGSSGDAMNAASTSLGGIANSGAAMVMDRVTASTADCPGGGTVVVDSLENAVISYSALQCVTADGVVLNGVLYLSSGVWEETGTEVVLETGADGFSTGTCSFSGGIAVRFKMEQTQVAEGTQTLVVAEYATSEDGFVSNCGDEAFSLAGGTSVRNEFVYTLNSNGELVSMSNTVTAGGKFEAPDGSGYLNVTSQNLEYTSNTDTYESGYGTAQCPSSGSITVEGDGGSKVDVYFGPDAGDGYEVQVIGPDYPAQYTTCADFLAASQ